MMHVSQAKKPLTPAERVISPNRTPTTCTVCGGPVRQTRQKKEICSSRCRLLKWAAHTLLEAYRAGQADGLKAIVHELAQVKR
jgi:endogenous inhibitor of DNA gyrase (YacG/DUF329 family)